jgi:hypothetical protein
MAKEVKNYDDDLIEDDAIDAQDLKINVAVFMQHAIMGQQKALSQEDKNLAFLQYIEYTEQLELLCISREYVPENYKKLIEKKKEDLEKETKISDLAKLMRLARFKASLLYKEIFNNDTLTMSLST